METLVQQAILREQDVGRYVLSMFFAKPRLCPGLDISSAANNYAITRKNIMCFAKNNTFEKI